VLWGTDSIWYGSPQDQIQAFRTFQIAEELRDKYGYLEITPRLRAKVFGLNAMRPYHISIEEMKQRAAHDRIASERLAYRETPNPHFRSNFQWQHASHVAYDRASMASDHCSSPTIRPRCRALFS
jgi:hypothetical protein